MESPQINPTCSAFSHAKVVEGLIQTASVGQLQLSLGTTRPPSRSMAAEICALRSGKRSAQGTADGAEEDPAERRDEVLLPPLLPLSLSSPPSVLEVCCPSSGKGEDDVSAGVRCSSTPPSVAA